MQGADAATGILRFTFLIYPNCPIFGMEIDGSFQTDYWKHVILEWESNDGSIHQRVVHTHEAELQSLRDDILAELQQLENNQSGIHADPDFDQDNLDGFPDETMLPREYSHKLVALFAMSCGIMERQLGILLSIDLIPDSRRDGVVNDGLDSMSLGKKLEFARDTRVIGNGLFSEAWDVRRTRNRLVHNPVYRLSIDSYNVHRNRVGKAVRAPDEIDDLIENAL